MIAWENAEVLEIIEENEQLQIVKTIQQGDEAKAIHYLQFGRRLEIGDIVLLNRTANQLELGTGGYDFVVSTCVEKQNTKAKQWDGNGHIMKFRYTPLQFPVLSCEEQNSPYHSVFNELKSLNGLPVVIGELHSMLPTFITLMRKLEEKEGGTPRKIVYIMTDGGSLPITLSQHVRTLKEMNWLDHTITVGHAFGGDLEAVNIYTGLQAAKYIFQADIAIVVMGPGIVGTGTALGHTGIEQGEIINAVNILGGKPISIVRASEQDQRSRHYGISHHSITSLKTISLTSSMVHYPQWIETTYVDQFEILKDAASTKHQLIPITYNQTEVIEMVKSYPVPIKTMGRNILEDSLFLGFLASASIGAYLLKLS